MNECMRRLTDWMNEWMTLIYQIWQSASSQLHILSPEQLTCSLTRHLCASVSPHFHSEQFRIVRSSSVWNSPVRHSSIQFRSDQINSVRFEWWNPGMKRMMTLMENIENNDSNDERRIRTMTTMRRDVERRQACHLTSQDSFKFFYPRIHHFPTEH